MADECDCFDDCSTGKVGGFFMGAMFLVSTICELRPAHIHCVVKLPDSYRFRSIETTASASLQMGSVSIFHTLNRPMSC